MQLKLVIILKFLFNLHCNNSDRLSPPKTRSPISSNQTAIAPLTTHKPDRPFPQINQRSPLNTQNLIAYFPYQTVNIILIMLEILLD